MMLTIMMMTGVLVMSKQKTRQHYVKNERRKNLRSVLHTNLMKMIFSATLTKDSALILLMVICILYVFLNEVDWMK